MRLIVLLAVFVLGMQFTSATAADLKLFTLGSAAPILHELSADSERTTGNRLAFFTAPGEYSLDGISYPLSS